MGGHLRAVRDGDETEAPIPPASSLAEATARSRLEFLVMSRETIAKTIDAGVPAHALARLINEMNGIDADIRRLVPFRIAHAAAVSFQNGPDRRTGRAGRRGRRHPSWVGGIKSQLRQKSTRA